MTEYTAWHIGRLRDRLARYRAVEMHNGRARPWALVARDILDTEGLPERYWEAEASNDVFAEALRRFVDQKQIPKVERLDAITLFLRSKGYFSDADIGETQDGYGAALAMLDLLKIKDRGNMPFRDGVFTSKRRRQPKGTLLSMLEVLPVAGSCLARIKEALLESSTLIIQEGTFSPASPLRHTGMIWRHAEGWLIPGGQGTYLAFLQERLEGKRQILLMPYQESADAGQAGDASLIAMKLDRFEPTSLATDKDRPSVMVDQVAAWASEGIWSYRRQNHAAAKGKQQ